MKLLDQLRSEIRVRHYSIRTEQSYVRHARNFILYHRMRHPSEMDAKEINQFLSYLATNRNIAASSQNQALSAILFLYEHVLDRKIGDLGNVVRAKKPKKLPVVLSVTETESVLSNLTGICSLLGELMYGTGMRILKVLRLRVKDIDFDRKMIIVRDAKGRKDRSALLPESIVPRMKEQIAKAKSLHEKDLQEGYGTVYLPYALSKKYPNADKEWCWQYVFPAPRLSVDPRSGRRQRHHLSKSIIEKAIKRSAREAGIAKIVHPHTLRHNAEYRIMPSTFRICRAFGV